MIHHVITRVSLESFREKSAGKKVVLLYPWTNYRTLFLSHFLASTRDGLLYYRIPHDHAALSEWLDDFCRTLGAVLEGFGANLSRALADGSPQQLAQALAADLGSIHKQSVVLFIDELDRVVQDNTLNTFASALVNSLPKHVQLVFSSRLLTLHPWAEMIAAGIAVVLGTEYRKNDVIFTVEGEIKPQLEIYALGRGHALVNGQEITNWDGALPRNLFFYFIDNPLVTRDDIFSTFWPNLSVKEATNVFHVTKRKISERIGLKINDPTIELTTYAGGFYMPSDRIMRHYDAGDFQECVQRAAVTLDAREEETLYRRAVDLYKAPFLETIQQPWVQDRREQLRQLYAQALIGMGRIHKRRSENTQALGYFIRALKEIPEREDIHREVMSMYLALNQPQDALKQYDHLVRILASTLQISPSPETRELREQIEAQV